MSPASVMNHLLVFQLVSVLVLFGNIPHVCGNSVSLTPPTPFIVYEGGTARFTVSATSDISSITWTVNNQPLNMLSGISTDVQRALSNVYQLTLSDISTAYNNAVIRCTAVLTNGATVNCSPEGQLGVQGTLGIVESINTFAAADSSVNVSWSPPPAQTVTGESGPIIYYCVEVMNLTADMISTIESIGCNRSEDMNEQTSILVEDVRCGVHYNVTITPLNVVGDGRQSFVSLPSAADVMDRINYTQISPMTYSNTFPVLGLICSCSALVNNTALPCNIANGGFITITTENISPNIKFTVVITVDNFINPTPEPFNLTTFDISDLIVTNNGNSEINYSLQYAGNTSALGVFIIFLRTTTQSSNPQYDFSQSIYFIEGITESSSTNQFPVMDNGSYTVSAYDVEGNGRITSSSPADREMVTVTEQSNGNLSLLSLQGISCTSNISELSVSITCNYNTTLFRGFTAFLQSSSSEQLISASSMESGSSAVVTGSVEGTHNVFVYPIWPPDTILTGRMQPAFQNITELVKLIPSTTPSDVPNSSSRDTSSSDSTGGTSSSIFGVGTPGGNMAVIIGVAVPVIFVVIVIVAVLILVLCFVILKGRKKTSVSVDMNDVLVMDEKARRSPSDPEMIAPVYETARLPPPKIVSDSVKVNGDSSVPPPNDPAPDAPAPNVADLYSVVDKSRPQEQQYESVQLIKGTKKKVEDIHKVEYASLQHQDPQFPKENNEEPPPLPARPEGTEEPTRTYVRPVDCYEVLSGMAAEWKLLAEYLGMDEDDIDEVFTNNESDVACLNDFLSRICILSTKEDMSEALEKMGLMHESKAILTLPNRKLMEGQY